MASQKVTDAEILDTLKQARGVRAEASRRLKITTNSLRRRMDAIAARGEVVPDSTYDGRPFDASSTLYDGDGNVKLSWVKRDKRTPDLGEVAALVREQFLGTPRVTRIAAPKQANKDLLVVVPVGDHHCGMYSWSDETGADYDTKVAHRLLVSGAEHLIEVSPLAETCLIAQLGDFFHQDSHRAETPLHHNMLDADSRYANIIRAGVDMMRTFIECALAKYRRVRVINAPGNHDPVGALWLSLALSLLYEKNARVEIDTSPAKFTYHRHGKVLLGITHGDTAKLDKLAGVMAADQPELWGQTSHRFWFTGHIHQRRVIEQPGCMVESFRTLAARDAWASAGGYRSGRDMTSVVFHAEHGEVARHRFDVGMLQ